LMPAALSLIAIHIPANPDPTMIILCCMISPFFYSVKVITTNPRLGGQYSP
jgi:hypothetical protein